MELHWRSCRAAGPRGAGGASHAPTAQGARRGADYLPLRDESPRRWRRSIERSGGRHGAYHRGYTVAVGFDETAHGHARGGFFEDVGPGLVHLGEVGLPHRLGHGHAPEKDVPHGLELALQVGELLLQGLFFRERLVLVGRVRLGDERVDGRDELGNAPAPAPLRERDLAQVRHEADDVANVLLRFGRQANLEVELQAREPAREDHGHFLPEHRVGDFLVDVAPQPLVARLRRDRQRLLALPREDFEDRVLDGVDLDGRKSDVVLELREAREDLRDLRMVADGSRDQTRAIGQRPRLARHLQDRGGGILLDGRHRVRRPAEAAHLGAAARDLDQKLVGQLRARSQDRRVRDLEMRRDLLLRHRLLNDDAGVLRRLGARAVHRRHEEARQLRRLRKKLLPRKARLEKPRDRGDEPLPVPQREDVRESRQRRGIHASYVAADQDQRMTLAALRPPRRDPRGPKRLDDVDDVHLPGKGIGEQTEIGERCPRLEGDCELSIFIEEPLAHEVRHPVEEPVHPLEPEIGHPDLVGVREPDRHAISPEAVGILGKTLERSQSLVSLRSFHEEPMIIAGPRLTAHGSRIAIAQSVTFVPVGPVTRRSPRRSKKASVSCSARARDASSPRRRDRASVSPSAKAPAARELPSIPSEPAASTVTPRAPSRASAAPRVNSRLRPPRPCLPSSVTVVSPPASSTSPVSSFEAERANRLPSSRASPESLLRENRGDSPSLRASRAAASSPVRFDPATPVTSRRPPRTVGPEPTSAGRSPGTSERTSVTRRAEGHLPSLPPLMAERGLSSRLISTIEAPALISRRTARRLAASVNPARGIARREEVPPEMRHRMTSSGPKPAKKSKARRAARRLDASGSGCEEKRTSKEDSPAAGYPRGRTTSEPRRSRPGTPRTIAEAAFPQAKTPTRRASPRRREIRGPERARETALRGSTPPKDFLKSRRRIRLPPLSFIRRSQFDRICFGDWIIRAKQQKEKV